MTKYDITWNNSGYDSVVIEIETGSSAVNLKLVQHYCKLQMDANDSIETAEIREVTPNPVIANFKRDIVKVPENTSIDCPPYVTHFDTPTSNWIRSVYWHGDTSEIDVVFINTDTRTYKSDYATFVAFHDWVNMGGSAGRFYNQNLKRKQ